MGKSNSKEVIKQSLGLDVSKDTVAACLAQRQTGQEFRILSSHNFAISTKGLQQLDTWLKGKCTQGLSLHCMMEATGVYYEPLAYFLQEKGYRISVMLPQKTRAFGKSLDYRSKTDKVDAQKLAQMSLERDLPQWVSPSPIMLTIKRLCRERAEFIQQKVAFSNRRHAKKHAHAPEKSALKRSKETIEFLGKKIRQIEKDIEQAIDSDAQIKRKIGRVCSIVGVGTITAATIVAETNGFALFKNKAQLVCYAGYDVVENQSGTSINSPTRISKKGNFRIRKALHFPALVAVKKNPELNKLYQRVLDKTKIKMKAYVAVQRKLLVLIYTLYKNDQDFIPNFQSVKKQIPA